MKASARKPAASKPHAVLRARILAERRKRRRRQTNCASQIGTFGSASGDLGPTVVLLPWVGVNRAAPHSYRSLSTALTTAFIVLAGCAKPGPPIGYTPSSPTDPTRSEAPPAGGGGYDFGADLDTVRAKCAAEHGALKHSGKVSVCTARHEDIGATRVTLLEYCSGAVCRIHSLVMLDRSDAKSWLVPFEVLRRELQKRFGTPDEDHSELPADCETLFAECVRSGKASATLRWRWDDGHAVMLRLGTTEQVPAAISVSYEGSPGTPAR